ncbi:MAG: hypothetical protein ACOZNI_29425 [Myxococcota bacterium]
MWAEDELERRRRATDPPVPSSAPSPEDVEREARERKQRRAVDEPALPEGPGDETDPPRRA